MVQAHKSDDALRALYAQASNGNEEACKFLIAFHVWCHEIDDLVDGECGAEGIIRVAMHSASLFTMPFYQQFGATLLPHIAAIANLYADSVAWEKDEAEWKRRLADVWRSAGNEMIFAVAFICGGFDHMRKFSAALRAISYSDQHSNEKGN